MVASPFPDSRFDAAMRALTEMHAEAVLYRASIDAAERAFGQALRVGASVRRAVRQGSADRPNEADCSALEELTADLGERLARVADQPSVSSLRASLESGDGPGAARHALAVFAGLELADPRPAYGFRAVPVRRRRRSGETLTAPGDLARSLAARLDAGIAPDVVAGDATDAETPRVSVPEPIVLSPTLDGCGSEIALRVDLRRSPAPPLRHSATADLWIFARQSLHPLAVVILESADDEWWAASPIDYRAYVRDLRAALAARGITALLEGEADDRS